MKRVVIESPYAGDDPEGIRRNVAYARAALRHALDLGEAPFASHLLYTQVYDDSKSEERFRGLQAGYEWIEAADEVIFYVDLGWSPGMLKAKRVAQLFKKPIRVRTLSQRGTIYE